MSKKRALGRSLEEWMELVTECRQSGLTDAAWCNEHGISPQLFLQCSYPSPQKSLSDTESSWKSQHS